MTTPRQPPRLDELADAAWLDALHTESRPLTDALRACLHAQFGTSRDSRVVIYALVTLAGSLMYGIGKSAPPAQQRRVAAWFLSLANYFANAAALALPGSPGSAVLEGALTVYRAIVRVQVRRDPALRAAVKRQLAKLGRELDDIGAKPERRH